MKGLTNKYLREIGKLSVRKVIPLTKLIKAYNSARNKKERGVIGDAFIKNYLKTVAHIAKKISKATKTDLDDLLGEGNLMLCEYFSQQKKLKSDLQSRIHRRVESRLKRYALDDITEALKREKTSSFEFGYEPEEKVHLGKFSFLNLEEFTTEIEGILSERDYYVFSSHSGIYEEKSLKAIGEELGITRSRAAQLYLRAVEKISESIYKNRIRDDDTLDDFVDKEYPIHRKTPLIELPLSSIENLDHELQKKRGITLTQLATGLNLTVQQLSAFIRVACKYRPKGQERIKVSNKYNQNEKREYHPSKKEVKRRLSLTYEEITEYLGLTPPEFITYFNMSQEDFTEFIQERFPGLEDSYLKKVFSLKEGEISEDIAASLKEKNQLNELDLLERVLSLLQDDRYNKYFSGAYARITDRLKHAFFPLYVNDTEMCFSILEQKIAESEGKGKRYFREVYDFFNKSKDLEIETLKNPLDDFQKVDVLTLSDKGRHILASETGVGKSLEIIATAEYLNVDKVLVLTSKTSTISTWAKEIKKHLGKKAIVITGDDKDKDALFNKAKTSKWVACTYETYQRCSEKFKKLKPDMVVVDEADIMNNPNSLRTKAILNTHAKYKYCVSGWIYKNKRKELWPILNWLYPEEYPFRDQFVKDYCKDEWGRLKLKYELSHKLIYRPKSLVLPNLKPFKFKTIDVHMSSEEKASYLQVEENFVDWYRKNIEKEIPAKKALLKLHSLRRQALKPKFRKLYKILQKRHQRPNKTVVFSSYIDEARRIRDELSEIANVAYFDGQTSAEERSRVINDFNENPESDILVMSESGGKSIELISANQLYLFNPVWTYSFKKQIIDRLHRRGQKRIVRVFDVITEGTLEERINYRTEQKREEYEKTVIDTFGYSSWFEENQGDVIKSIIKDMVGKRILDNGY